MSLVNGYSLYIGTSNERQPERQARHTQDAGSKGALEGAHLFVRRNAWTVSFETDNCAKTCQVLPSWMHPVAADTLTFVS